MAQNDSEKARRVVIDSQPRRTVADFLLPALTLFLHSVQRLFAWPAYCLVLFCIKKLPERDRVRIANMGNRQHRGLLKTIEIATAAHNFVEGILADQEAYAYLLRCDIGVPVWGYFRGKTDNLYAIETPLGDGTTSLNHVWFQRAKECAELEILQRSWDLETNSMAVTLRWRSGPVAGKVYEISSGNDFALAMYGRVRDENHNLKKDGDAPARIYRPSEWLRLLVLTMGSLFAAALISAVTTLSSEYTKCQFEEWRKSPTPASEAAPSKPASSTAETRAELDFSTLGCDRQNTTCPSQ